MGIKQGQAMSPESTARLSDLATQWRDSREVASLALRRLEDGIITAVDEEKASTSEVARVIGVSPTRVYAIIAGAYRSAG